MDVERVLESSCAECRRIKEVMSHPDCIYMKGAKISPNIAYICHSCLDKKNREWREEKFPKEYAEIAELRRQNKTYKNNISLPDAHKKGKKKK